MVPSNMRESLPVRVGIMKAPQKRSRDKRVTKGAMPLI